MRKYFVLSIALLLILSWEDPAQSELGSGNAARTLKNKDIVIGLVDSSNAGLFIHRRTESERGVWQADNHK